MTILGFLGGTPEGTRNIMVSASSSRENLRRAFAFYGLSPNYKNNPNPSPAEIRFGLSCLGASVLIGLFKKRCHTNGFSDFRVADFLVFTLQAVTEMPKSKPTS